jgi:gas vesicle protein
MKFVTFLIGVGVGAGVALLYAPGSGEETRDTLAQKARAGGQYVSDQAQNVRSMADAASSLGREIVDNQKSAVTKAAQAAKETYLRESMGS